MSHEQNAHIGNKPKQITLSVSQNDLDAFNALYHWLDAVQKFGGKGSIPGAWDFQIFYRDLVHKCHDTDNV